MSTGPGRGVDRGVWQPRNRLLPAAPAIHGGTEDLAEEVTATINGTVRFNCEATGHPAPAVSWLWNDVPIVVGPRHQLLEGGTVLQVGVCLGRVAVPAAAGGGTGDTGWRGRGTLPSPRRRLPWSSQVPRSLWDPQHLPSLGQLSAGLCSPFAGDCGGGR